MGTKSAATFVKYVYYNKTGNALINVTLGRVPETIVAVEKQ
jgi:hypothetical protein